MTVFYFYFLISLSYPRDMINILPLNSCWGAFDSNISQPVRKKVEPALIDGTDNTRLKNPGVWFFVWCFPTTTKSLLSWMSLNSGHRKCWEMFSTKNLALCWKLKKKIRILIKSERVFDGGAISYFATTHFLSFVPLQVVTHRSLEQRRTQPKVRFITFSAKLGTGPKKKGLLCGSVCKLLSAVYNFF